jgi:hypothetical protein
MESKYYTSLVIENSQYVGKVYLTNNNQLVYTSKPYNSQEQAITDIRTFVITSAPPDTVPTQTSAPITNTTKYTTPAVTGRRCCGR